jgi:putative ABC transport system permease protein
MMKRKGFTFINIAGLAIGMAVCLLIILFVQSELGYDTHNDKADRIQRVVLERYYPGRSTSYATIPLSLGEAIKAECPEVEDYTRLFDFSGNGSFFVRIGEKVFEEKRILAVDSNFFSVFSGQALAGNLRTALAMPNAAVLTESTAKRFFGSLEAAVGKEFKTDGNDSTNHFVVQAVVADWPENVHFQFDILLSDVTYRFIRDRNYVNFSAHTYLLLKPNADAKTLEGKFPDVVKKYVSGEIGRTFNMSWEQFQKAGNGYRYYLQPLTRIHLTSDLEAELRPNGSMASVYIFTIIAIFILFLACINFINLSTARSVERAKEVGMRKTFGSERSALVMQFLAESVLVSLVSLVLALGVMLLLLPLFNSLSGKDLSVLYFLKPRWILLMPLFALLTGLLAGLYPAFVLSSFQPILVLKGKFRSSKFGLTLRNGLVVFQFAISVILIIATLVVNRQMRFMLGDKLGFNKEQVVVIERTDLLEDKIPSFKDELQKIPGVIAASGTSTMPGNLGFFGLSFQREGATETMTGRGVITDEDFARTLGLELVDGRFFSRDYSTDSLSLVINERALGELGLTKETALGARLNSRDEFLNAPDGSTYMYTIVGVVRDFHFHSLHEPISPLVFVNARRFNYNSGLLALKVAGGDMRGALAAMERTWSQFVKDRPFNFYFLDQKLAAQYQAEQTTRKLFTIFSGLAIFIACIGLLGLTAYATQQRIREISIRKVLGATGGNIVTMLSRDFLRLVMIAALLAFPVAWWMMHRWLQDFAYRVQISWWVFGISAGSALLVALLTVSFQAVKAAMANPVKTLRSE